MRTSKVALAPFLNRCAPVITLGIRASLADYSDAERDLLLDAERIFFPTPRFIDLFHALERPTFPSAASYHYQRSRLLQHVHFRVAGWPHPSGRIYFGARQKRKIFDEFRFPLILMGPKIAPGTLHIVERPEGLPPLLDRYNPVLVREAVSWQERLRLVCVNFEPIAAHALVSSGSPLPFPAPLPLHTPWICTLSQETSRLLREAHLDDIAVEWGYSDGKWQVIGLCAPPVRWTSTGSISHRHRYICELIGSGRL